MYIYTILFLTQGHSSFITHLDWSKDGKYIMSNSGDYEILYCKCVHVYFTCPSKCHRTHSATVWLSLTLSVDVFFLKGTLPEAANC